MTTTQPFDEQREVKFRPAPEVLATPVRSGMTEAEGRAMLNAQAAEPLPEGVELPLVLHLVADAGHSVQMGSVLLGPGETMTIDSHLWRQLGRSGPSIVALLRDHDLQRSRFDAVLLREGPGQPLQHKPGSLPWRRRKQEQFAAVDNMHPGPERDQARAQLEAHYAAPEQQEPDARYTVESRDLGSYFQ